MSEPIKIPVDLTNPGQFFACCGLLELADRLWPGAEVAGWFQLHRFDRATFCVTGTATFKSKSLVETFLGCQRHAVDPFRPIRGSDGKPVKDPEKTRPIMIGPPVNLRLSWWLNELDGRQTRFKTWSANTTSTGLFDDTAAKIDPAKADYPRLLVTPIGMTNRFGFDSRSTWDRLNTGYSPNLHHEVDSYPAVEMLAAIALQTFCPIAVEDQYFFTPWEHALPTIVARAAANNIINISNTPSYSFKIVKRGKFKNFSKAQLVRKDHT